MRDGAPQCQRLAVLLATFGLALAASLAVGCSSTRSADSCPPHCGPTEELTDETNGKDEGAESNDTDSKKATSEASDGDEDEKKPPELPLDYPSARRAETTRNVGGDSVPDPYGWLENQGLSSVEEWVEKQDALARRYLKLLPGRRSVRNGLEEARSHHRYDDVTLRGGRIFFRRSTGPSDPGRYYWSTLSDPNPRPLIPRDQIETDEEIEILRISPSRDGTQVVFVWSPIGKREYTLQIVDVDAGEIRKNERIRGAHWADGEWHGNADGFYYVKFPVDSSLSVGEKRARAHIRYHSLGDDPRNDRVVRPATDNPNVEIWAETSAHGNWLTFGKKPKLYGTEIELRVRPIGQSDADWELIPHDDIFIHDGDVYFWTEGSSEALVRSAMPDPSIENPTVVVEPPDRGQVNGVSLLKDYLLTRQNVGLNHKFVVHEFDGSPVRELDPEGVSSIGSWSADADSNRVVFVDRRFLEPPQLYVGRADTGELASWQKQSESRVAKQFRARRITYDGGDGVEIPMTLVVPKDLEEGEKRPVLVQTNPGLGYTFEAQFLEGLFPWLQHGGIVAIPHIRGSGLFGEDWHLAAKGVEKPRAVEDYRRALRVLVDRGYTRPDRIAAFAQWVGSVVPLAVAARHPELLGAVAVHQPMTDLYRYHEFNISASVKEEFGTVEDAEHLEALRTYSPYHNRAEDSPHPATLFLTTPPGGDARPHPMHARKYIAALQHANPKQGPYLFRTAKLRRELSTRKAIETWLNWRRDLLAFLMYRVGLVE